MKLKRIGAVALFIAFTAFGCAGAPGDVPEEDLATVQVALTNVPPNAFCVRFSVTSGMKMSQQSFGVMPGSMVTLALGGFPAGPSTFTAEAFNVVCASVTPNSLPTWVSTPVSVGLSPGEIKNQAVTLRPSAGVSAAVDFVYLSISPSSQAFGNIILGQQSPPTTFTVKNVSTLPTAALLIAVSGANVADFILGGTSCPPLPAGGTCTVTVRFAPTSTGAKSAAFIVSGNPGGAVTAPLVGTGVTAAQLVVFPSMFDFGFTSSSVTTTLNVGNGGGLPTGSLTFFLSGTECSNFSLVGNNCGTSLVAGTNCTATVRFTSTLFADRTCTFGVTASPGGIATSSLRGGGSPF